MNAPQCYVTRTLPVLFHIHYMFQWGYAVAQLVEALRYKPEGRVFDSRWSYWIFQ